MLYFSKVILKAGEKLPNSSDYFYLISFNLIYFIFLLFFYFYYFYKFLFFFNFCHFLAACSFQLAARSSQFSALLLPTSVPTCLSSSATNCCNEHTYAVPHCSVPTKQQCTINTSVSPNQPAILSVIPCIGPLHVSLNAQETVFKDFRGFFADVYCKLFPRCQLARSSKPWRISLILELVYGGWLFIRDAVKNKFSVCKDIEYRTFLNLLDNYLPLVLPIYTVTFKLNNFTEYFHGMIKIWTMFVCLERRHYNKAPLVWLAMVTHWGMYHPGLYQMLQSNLVLFDEYPVENAHSIIRARTNDSDTAEQLIQKAKSFLSS